MRLQESSAKVDKPATLSGKSGQLVNFSRILARGVEEASRGRSRPASPPAALRGQGRHLRNPALSDRTAHPMSTPRSALRSDGHFRIGVARRHLLCAATLVLAILPRLPCGTAFGLAPGLLLHTTRAAVPLRRLAMPLGATLRKTRLLGLGMMSGEGEGAEEGGPDGKDWRDFRARLVSQEKGVESKDGAEDWAYAGALVEQGTVLMGAEGELGFGLRQQYFHKVVMLVVSQEKSFTKALIVNRPTSRTTPRGWRIWFGGDVSGINAPPRLQEWTVLHRLTSREAHEMSYGVLPYTLIPTV